MDPRSANALITQAKLADPRTQVDPDKAEWWAELLGDVTLPEAMEALREHQATSTEYLMPAHITTLVRRARARQADRERVQRQLSQRGTEPAPVPQPDCPKHPGHGIANCRECYPLTVHTAGL